MLLMAKPRPFVLVGTNRIPANKNAISRNPRLSKIAHFGVKLCSEKGFGGPRPKLTCKLIGFNDMSSQHRLLIMNNDANCYLISALDARRFRRCEQK